MKSLLRKKFPNFWPKVRAYPMQTSWCKQYGETPISIFEKSQLRSIMVPATSLRFIRFVFQIDLWEFWIYIIGNQTPFQLNINEVFQSITRAKSEIDLFRKWIKYCYTSAIKLFFNKNPLIDVTVILVPLPVLKEIYKIICTPVFPSCHLNSWDR